MSKVTVNAFSVSADGFGAGPDQSRKEPLGRGGEQLHDWLIPTRTFQRNVQRREDGEHGEGQRREGCACHDVSSLGDAGASRTSLNRRQDHSYLSFEEKHSFHPIMRSSA